MLWDARAARCRDIMRLLKTIILFTRPATTLDRPANIASSPIPATVAGASSKRLSEAVG